MTAYAAVAWSFIVYGLLAIVSMVAAWPSGGLLLDAGILGIPLGVALLRGAAWSRRCALFVSRLAAIGAVAMAVILPFVHAPLTLRVFAKPVGAAPLALAYVGLGLGLALALWQQHVLAREPLPPNKPGTPANAHP